VAIATGDFIIIAFTHSDYAEVYVMCGASVHRIVANEVSDIVYFTPYGFPNLCRDDEIYTSEFSSDSKMHRNDKIHMVMSGLCFEGYRKRTPVPAGCRSIIDDYLRQLMTY
jgi:hypothetical protein